MGNNHLLKIITSLSHDAPWKVDRSRGSRGASVHPQNPKAEHLQPRKTNKCRPYSYKIGSFWNDGPIVFQAHVWKIQVVYVYNFGFWKNTELKCLSFFQKRGSHVSHVSHVTCPETFFAPHLVAIFEGVIISYKLPPPPTQDSSHHQGSYIFRIGNF